MDVLVYKSSLSLIEPHMLLHRFSPLPLPVTTSYFSVTSSDWSKTENECRDKIYAFHRAALKFTLREERRGDYTILDADGLRAGQIVLEDSQALAALRQSYHLNASHTRAARVVTWQLDDRMHARKDDILHAVQSQYAVDLLYYSLEHTTRLTAGSTWATVYSTFTYQTPRRLVAFPNNLKDGQLVPPPLTFALWTYAFSEPRTVCLLPPLQREKPATSWCGRWIGGRPSSMAMH